MGYENQIIYIVQAIESNLHQRPIRHSVLDFLHFNKAQDII